MITVLLADDHAMVRDGLRYLLEAAEDLQIVALASHGREAVEQALLHHPDATGDESVHAVRTVHNGQRYVSPKVQDIAKRFL